MSPSPAALGPEKLTAPLPWPPSRSRLPGRRSKAGAVSMAGWQHPQRGTAGPAAAVPLAGGLAPHAPHGSRFPFPPAQSRWLVA